MITPIQFFACTKALFLFFTIVEDARCFPADQPFPHTIDLRLSFISSERCTIEKGVRPNTHFRPKTLKVFIFQIIRTLATDPFNYASDKPKITIHKIIRLPLFCVFYFTTLPNVLDSGMISWLLCSRTRDQMQHALIINFRSLFRCQESLDDAQLALVSPKVDPTY